MIGSSRNYRDLAIVFAVAALANFGYLYFSNGDYYYPDSFTYLAPARALMHGRGFLDQTGIIETLRTPGYPLLLLLLGAHTLPAIVLQHLLNCFAALGIYIIVLFRSERRPALVASLLFAIDVPTLHYANKLLSETVFTALLYVLFALALHKFRPIAFGVMSGALVLIRPIALFYFVPLAIFFIAQRIPMRKVAVFVVVSLVLPCAWAVRNRIEGGVFTVSSIGDFNLLNYRAAGALAIEDEGDFRKAVLEEGSALSDEVDDDVQAKLHIEDATELPPAVRARYFAHYAWGVIGQHRLSFVQLTARGLLVNLFDSDWEAIWNVSQVSPDVLRLFFNALAVAEIVLATIGVIFLWRRDRAMALLIILTVAYFIGISAGGEAEARFRVPVMPEIAIAAAMGIEAIRDSPQRERRGRRE
jgi:hypothetical protein